jgi:hypothetical protein
MIELPRLPTTEELCRQFAAAMPPVLEAFRRIEEAKRAFARVSYPVPFAPRSEGKADAKRDGFM